MNDLFFAILALNVVLMIFCWIKGKDAGIVLWILCLVIYGVLFILTFAEIISVIILLLGMLFGLTLLFDDYGSSKSWKIIYKILD